MRRIDYEYIQKRKTNNEAQQKHTQKKQQQRRGFREIPITTIHSKYCECVCVCAYMPVCVFTLHVKILTIIIIQIFHNNYMCEYGFFAA